MVHITISGKVPSKKNSKRAFVNKRTGARFLVPSKAHSEWHEDAMWQITSWRNKQPTAIRHNLPLRRAVEITLYFFAGESRKNDLTNKAESVMDLLVDAKILEDDNWDNVPYLALQYGGIDRTNPRVEINIV